MLFLSGFEVCSRWVPLKRVQWNPVNTVSNGPKRIGRFNGLGSMSLIRLLGR